MKQELSPAIDDYLRFRRSQDFSKGTIKMDQQVLKRFLSVTGNVWCHALNERHVARHFEVASRTRANSSLANDHGVLIRFFKWARHTGRMSTDNDPMFGRRQPKATKRERNRIPVSDFPRLLDAAEAHDPRDRALIAVLLYTLSRDSEVTDMRIRDLKLDQGWLHSRVQKSRLEDNLPISTELDREMRHWLTYYTQTVGPLEPHYYLIPARQTNPVRGPDGRIAHHLSTYQPLRSVRAAGRLVGPILKDIGFPVVDENGKACNEGAHTIRRSGARAYFDQLVGTGYDHALRVVQSLLHHASVQQTEVYLGITADRRSRDDLIRGHEMYPSTRGNVIPIAR